MSDLGHVIRAAHDERARESFNRFFRGQQDNEPEAETTEFVDLDAGARSSPPPQPVDWNVILRNAIEESIGDRLLRRRWG